MVRLMSPLRAVLVLTIGCGSPAPMESEAVPPVEVTAESDRPVAGEVFTLVEKLDGAMDGLSVAADGAIYASSNLTAGGFELVRIDLDGAIGTVVDDMPFPLGHALDAEGNLYVACWNDGAIHRISPDGADTVYSQGSSPPSDLAFGLDGSLYITNFEANTIDRIPPGGDRELFSSSDKYNHPHGLSVADDGTLYVGNYSDGKVFVLDTDGTPERIAKLPSEILGYMTWLDGFLYATGASTHIVYQIGSDGVVLPFAGSGAEGSDDGSAFDASIRPNGITGDPERGRLYVSEPSGKLRVIPVVPSGT